jgi:hypothetical protein
MFDFCFCDLKRNHWLLDGKLVSDASLVSDYGQLKSDEVL